MIVTSEINMSDNEIYTTYHNLWRIEESFKIMKSQLDARPVYLQNEESIYGHFLICYISVLLLRILQIKIMNDKYSMESIMSFVRDFNVVTASPRKNINITKKSEITNYFQETTKIPINNFDINQTMINKLMNYEFNI